MAMSFRAPTGHVRVSGRHRVRAVSVLICLIVSTLSIGVQADKAATGSWQGVSGLHTFAEGTLVRVTIIERGAAAVHVARRDRIERSRKPSRGTQGRPTHAELNPAVGSEAGRERWSRPVERLRRDYVRQPRAYRSARHVRGYNSVWGWPSRWIRPVGPVSIPGDPQALLPRVARKDHTRVTTGCARARLILDGCVSCTRQSVALLAMQPCDATAQISPAAVYDVCRGGARSGRTPSCSAFGRWARSMGGSRRRGRIFVDWVLAARHTRGPRWCSATRR